MQQEKGLDTVFLWCPSGTVFLGGLLLGLHVLNSGTDKEPYTQKFQVW